MAVVELHIHDPLLPHLDPLWELLDGVEVGRRRSQFVDDVTIIDVAMMTAPSHAAVMEVALQWVDDDVQILSLVYFDEAGHVIKATANQDQA